MPLLKDGVAQTDDKWVRVEDDADLPEDCHALVSMTRWLKDRDTLLTRNKPIGVALESSDNPDEIMDDLDRFGLIAVDFPLFKDGRGFSYGRLIRHRGKFAGELRATGGVLVDQLHYLARCGYDAVDGDERITEEAWAEANSRFSQVYQSTGDGRPTVLQRRHGG